MKRKLKKDSLVNLTKKYSNNNDECINFFTKIKYPTGYYCEKCGCTHHYKITRHHVFQCKKCAHQQYLFANTIFQDNKLDLYKLILGLFLFFTSNKGISAAELASELDVNYKTALLLARKCRILMSESNSNKVLDSMFYESDVIYIGAKSKGNNHQGCATEQQPFLVILSTKKENQYPGFLKMYPIPIDNSNHLSSFIKKSIRMGKERTLNTDGKTTFSSLKTLITLKSEKINYDEPNHKLYWLNTIVGNIKNQITGIYHGVCKRDLPLFINEQAFRFNHRNSGTTFIEKIQKYITLSKPTPKNVIVKILDLAEPHFNHLCV